MKYVLLIFIILCIAAGIALNGRVILIQLQIPPHLMPYYEWLLSFPGLNHEAESPLQENHPRYEIRSA